MQLLLIFIGLNIFNVILQTAKSIITIKAGKVPASLINGLAYGLYTVVIVYLNSDLSLILKIIVVAITNLIGVYVVKLFEEKFRRDKLWKIEFSIKDTNKSYPIDKLLQEKEISFNKITTGNYLVYNCFAATQKESLQVKKIIELYDAKYFVTESKIL